ncbi:hypothetical protein QBC32DRAFT_156885 [Pseudoneurospora amorphoporcata]|uniref:K Homology domain-containing protein n=1 Tax=Pseudoneurospora amorphoporcata TaxID=241081 RepID=A0AAN6P1W8_9PEZI|nr:hypothetical protein QBC32DRAFT_156885 [Pseudoneurospora amorphoporcata]
MNKLANMRHWPERMSPNFGMSRSSMGMPQIMHQPKIAPQGPPPISNPQPPDAMIHYTFNVHFASDLAGPDTEDILHSTTDAVLRWTHPEDAPDDVPVWQLPVHTQNVENLRRRCEDITNNPMPIEAHLSATTPKNGRNQVVTVTLSGTADCVYKTRETILNETPSLMRCTHVDVDGHLVADLTEGRLKPSVTAFLDEVSKFCGVDIFLLGPKLTPLEDGLNGGLSMRRDQRWRVAIYGDHISAEHAKSRVLIKIDQLLGRIVDAVQIDLSVQPLLCGRNRKNIKHIESATNTAIYFPPCFSHAYGYCPPGALRRNPDEVFITGETPEAISQAKARIHQILTTIRLFVKDVTIAMPKIDSILLGRMDKVRKIMETNSVFIMLPPLASRQGTIRFQGPENLHVERAIRELMSLAGQFYHASWWINQQDPRLLPSAQEIRALLSDVCANSDADIAFDKVAFTLTGSDEAVKEALQVLSDIKFLTTAQHQIRVKIELANEHKEFVSGKKNGKINKIMSHCNVQIVFDNFGEYNFNIDVLAHNYTSMKEGLTLVEQEMPASISFHVPDQYHKRIIGIGGQHIQRIMKKHSVFVKFSNAMDRGGMGRDDDDSRVDNVICRTPARNAQNLELVKTEILEMVDREDSEITTQTVNVDRLYHRQLLARLSEIEVLEKKYNCKISFPSTEQASDEVTVQGPQWQVPMCADEFLGMVPDKHEVVLEHSEPLVKFLESPEFLQNIVPKLKSQHEVQLSVHENTEDRAADAAPTVTLLWAFTRNNAGGLRDAMDFLHSQFATVGIEPVVIKGAIPRPRSDTFEEALQYFDSKILQHVAAPVATDAPATPTFGEDLVRERSNIFDRLRKPGSMSLSFLDRRKNSSHSTTNSFFKGSANVSKTSLISIESSRSFNADRNPWNDSGVNLPDDDNNPWGTSRVFEPNGLIHKLAIPMGGDSTPRHGTRHSGDSGRPSTSHSTNSGYPGPLSGPFR